MTSTNNHKVASGEVAYLYYRAGGICWCGDEVEIPSRTWPLHHALGLVGNLVGFG